MTNKITKVDINKKYKTRDGRDVVLYAVYEDTIHGGIIYKSGSVDIHEWCIEGRTYAALKMDSYCDLIEVEEGEGL